MLHQLKHIEASKNKLQFNTTTVLFMHLLVGRWLGKHPEAIENLSATESILNSL